MEEIFQNRIFYLFSRQATVITSDFWSIDNFEHLHSYIQNNHNDENITSNMYTSNSQTIKESIFIYPDLRKSFHFILREMRHPPTLHSSKSYKQGHQSHTSSFLTCLITWPCSIHHLVWTIFLNFWQSYCLEE